jgi:hypothetical protein
VIHLLGEYVVEISERILERLDELQIETYRRFAAANESFMPLTRDHVVSYWACYYRPSTCGVKKLDRVAR